MRGVKSGVSRREAKSMWSCGEYEQKNPRYTKGFFVLFVFRVLVFGISFADRGAAGSAMCG